MAKALLQDVSRLKFVAGPLPHSFWLAAIRACGIPTVSLQNHVLVCIDKKRMLRKNQLLYNLESPPVSIDGEDMKCGRDFGIVDSRFD